MKPKEPLARLFRIAISEGKAVTAVTGVECADESGRPRPDGESVIALGRTRRAALRHFADELNLHLGKARGEGR